MKDKDISINEMSIHLNMTPQGFLKILRENSTKVETLEAIADKLKVSAAIFFDDKVELMTDEEIGIHDRESDEHKLIPLYDTESIGGKNQYGADMTPVSTPTAYINPGDFLKDATAALRHYGDSMTEYPQGCILALRRLYENLNRLTPGRNYVIETSEDRFTKRLQIGDNETYYMAYSSNDEKYEDGRLIHEPFRIYFEDIKKVFLVVGHIRKESLGEILYEPAN